MTITGSGLYGLTFEKALTNAAALDFEAEDTKVALVTDSYTPDFNAHDFYADISANEVVGSGYTAGGATLTGTTLTPSGGFLTFDATDLSVGAVTTITDAMAAVGYFDAVNDELTFLLDFVNPASSSNGPFSITWDPVGIWRVDISAA